MKITKVLCMIIACAMAVVFLCQEPMRVLANAQSDANKYLADIKLITDCSATEAQNWFHDNGYKIATGDFVKETYGDNAYLGYKTTTDKNEAITDMRLMNMNGGYEIIDFNEKLENNYTAQFNAGAQKIMNAFKEFKKNVDAHDKGTRLSPMAKAGQEMLNELSYKDTPLYDFLVSDSCTLNDYKRIIATVSQNAMTYIFFCLMLGVYDDANTDFQTKLDNNELFAVKETDDYGALDAALSDEATELYYVVKQYIESYKIAKKNYEKDMEVVKSQDPTDNTTVTADLIAEKMDASTAKGGIVIINDGDSEKSDLPELGEKNSENETPAITQAESLEDVDAQKSDLDAAAGHLYTVNSFVVLSKYKITSDYADNLGDYLMKSAENENETLGVRMLYPIVSMFTTAQLLALKSVGFESFSLFLDNNSQDTYSLFHNELVKVSDGTPCSVTADVDTDMYDKTAAYTDATIRSEASGKKYVYEARNHDGYHKTESMKMRKILSITVIATGAIFIIGSVAIGLGGGVLFGAITVAVTMASMMITSGVVLASSLALVIGGALIAVALVAMVAIVVMLIIWLVHLFSKDDPEPIVRTEIPDIMYDTPADSIIKYEALVNPLTGKPVDLTGGKGDEWDVLYYTYSTKYGSPIRVIDDQLFLEKTTNESVEKMMPLWRFGDQMLAADTKKCIGNGFDHLYLYYYTDDSLAGKSGGTTLIEGQYISDVKMAEGPYENTAKYLLSSQGFTVIDNDLTPTDGSIFTYIGYKTTSDVANALTDIRVGYKVNTDTKQYYFGKSSYGCAGTTSYGASIFTTQSEYAGTPISADAGLIALNNRENAPEGYEPVSLFCGGDAFDMCFHDDHKANEWGLHLYIYYRPSVTYTSGPEYISGLATICAKDCEGQTPNDYIKACGFERIDPYYTNADVNLMKYRTGGTGSTYDGIYEDRITRLCISKTRNPYRALTDIQMMDYSCQAPVALSSITYAKNSYSVCEVFSQGCEGTRDARNIRSTKSYTYTTPSHINAGSATYLRSGGESEDISCEKPFARNFYVTAGTGGTPIGVDDIAFCLNADTPEKLVAQKPELGSASEWQGVHEFGHPYDNNAKQMCHQIYEYFHVYYNEMRYTYVDSHFYMYIRRATPERPKYVSSIKVCTSLGEDNWTNDFARMSAWANGEGELIEYNFAEYSNKQWKSTSGNRTILKNINGVSSYIYVTYQDSETGSIRDVRMVSEHDIDNPSAGTEYYFQVWDNKTNAPAISKYSKDDDSTMNLMYTCCGDKICYQGTNYYLFATKNTFFGNGVTDFYYNRNTLEKDAKTVTWFNGDFFTGSEYYFHIKREIKEKDARYAAKIVTVNGSSERDCLNKIYNYGCDSVLDYNFSTSNTGCCLIGYKELTTQQYDYVVTGLKMVCHDSNVAASTLGTMNMEQYCAFNDEYIKSDYTCLSKDNSMGSITTQVIMDGGVDNYQTVPVYRYLYGTYNEELSLGVLMNTLTITEGSDIAPDMVKEISSYEKLLEGAVKGSFSIKTRKSLTTIKALYNIYKYGASTYSKYIVVTNTIPIANKEQYNIGDFNDKSCMWYQNTDTYNRKPYTGDIVSLFDSAYTNNKTLKIYPALTDNEISGNHIIFGDLSVNSTLTVPENKNITIITLGHNIKATGATLFDVQKGASLTLYNNTTKNGVISSESTSNEYIVNVSGKFTANKTTFTSAGSGIIKYNGEGMTLTNCKFTNTSGAMSGSYISAQNGSKITVTGTTFASASFGNAVPVDLNGVDADITNCTFSDNTAETCAAIRAQNNTVNIKNTTIKGCKTTQTDNAGIVYLSNSNASLTDCTLSDNSMSLSGGAVYAQSSNVTLNNNIFTNNNATNGGALYAVDSTVNSKGSTYSGNGNKASGAIHFENCTATLQQETMSENSATNGGVMWIKGSTVTLTGCTLNNNKATNGGAVYANNSSLALKTTHCSQNNASEKGGGIYLNGTKLSMTQSYVQSNTAGTGGGIYATGKNTVLNMTYATITGNTATAYDSATKTYGIGGIHIDGKISKIYLSANVQITGNTSSKQTSNLYLPKDVYITCASSLSGLIGVTSEVIQKGLASTVVLTTGMVYSSSARCFKSDVLNCALKYSNYKLTMVGSVLPKTASATPPTMRNTPDENDKNSNTTSSSNSNSSDENKIDSLASVFTNGNILIIGGGCLLLIAVFVLLYMNRKKIRTIISSDDKNKAE